MKHYVIRFEKQLPQKEGQRPQLQNDNDIYDQLDRV